ncbi:hypothetical protein ACI0X9_003370 [Cronobacter turicensis]
MTLIIKGEINKNWLKFSKGMIVSFFDIGTLVFIYQHEECRGRCLGLDEISEVIHSDNGTTLYRMRRNYDDWHESTRLQAAQRPPAGTQTSFAIGDRVRCYGTYHYYAETATIEHIVWSEGKPFYYVTPSSTPWYPYNDDSLSKADESVNIPEHSGVEGMLF